MSDREMLADLDATPGTGGGYSPEEVAEYEAWRATLSAEDVEADPDAASIYSFFLGKLAESDVAARAEEATCHAGPGDDEIPF